MCKPESWDLLLPSHFSSNPSLNQSPHPINYLLKTSPILASLEPPPSALTCCNRLDWALSPPFCPLQPILHRLVRVVLKWQKKKKEKKKTKTNTPLCLNVYNEFLLLSTSKSLTLSTVGPCMTWPWPTVPHFTLLWVCFLGIIHTHLIFQLLKQAMLPFYPRTFIYAIPSTYKVVPYHILLISIHFSELGLNVNSWRKLPPMATTWHPQTRLAPYPHTGTSIPGIPQFSFTAAIATHIKYLH